MIAHPNLEAARLLDDLGQDTHAALRGVARYPIACAVAVLSLAGGIGATAATMTVRDVVFHKPPPLYAEPGQLSQIQVGTPERPIMPIGSPVPGRLFSIWQEDGQLGATLAAAQDAAVHDVRTGDRTAGVRVQPVTSNLFALLGVGAARGRTFADGDVAAGAGSSPAIVSDRVWRTLFDGRADVVGTSIWIDNVPHTIVGVMPPRFWFSDMQPLVWTAIDPRTLSAGVPLDVVARRARGVTPEGFEAALERGLGRFTRALPAAERQLHLKVSPVEGTPLGKQVSIVLPWLLAGAVVLTLLIACANVAILMIAQWTGREHEIAIRASLGASRGRVVRMLVTESILIACAGGALGILATYALRGLMIQRGGSTALLFDLSIDPRILAQAVAISLGAGLAAGIAPALYETRRLEANPLHGLAASDRVRQRWRHVLVVGEITVTVALLVVAGAMLDGYRRNMAAHVGFSTRPLIAARVENARGVPTAVVLDALRRVPGVASVAAATSVPFSTSGPTQQTTGDTGAQAPIPAERCAVTADFFQTLDVPIRAGRNFSAFDSEATRTAIVNEALARRLFPNRPAVGHRMSVGPDSFEIVGVVADYSNNTFQESARDAKFYLPLATTRNAGTRLPLLIRTFGDPAPLVDPIRRAARNAAPGMSVMNTYTIDEIINVGGQEILVGTAPLVPLIATGMALTAAGIYGVLAFAFARRSKELAVRVAIGATRQDIVRLVAGHSVRLIALGTTFGIGATFGLARVVRASGGAGSMFDASWPAFLVPVLVIAAVGAAATWTPSRRARGINPAILLRTD